MDANSRDEMLSKSIMNLYELGKFEKELAIYGCAYQDESGEIIYVLSTDANNLYDWKYNKNNLSKRATIVHRTTIRTLIPTGMEEIITEQLQKKIVRELHKHYPKEYFVNLVRLDNTIPSNKSYNLLKEIQFQLDGLGTIEQLELYQGLINQAYLNKILKEKHYYDFCKWIEVEKEDISNDLQKTDIYKKEFYGFTYAFPNNAFKNVVDGNKGYIYAQMEKLQLEGALVSPIIQKRFWYNNNYRLNDAKKDSKCFFELLFSNKYREILLKLDEMIKNEH